MPDVKESKADDDTMAKLRAMKEEDEVKPAEDNKDKDKDAAAMTEAEDEVSKEDKEEDKKEDEKKVDESIITVNGKKYKLVK
jgi:hypothetical protein